ncbi:MAG: hemerythrin domain-containing protein [Bacteroidales bacterium]|nr:hemerythrin domain-containing protein [Bacteroidales bacterium]
MITADKKMADLIHMNYLLVSVISRFGIQLGFGEKTVSQVCDENNVNTDFFLEIINSFNDKEYFPEKHLQDFSIQLIIDYLGKTHQYYLKEKIPEIEQLIDQMIKKCYSHNKHAHLLSSFFKEYKEELVNHISREDETVFPYAIKIEKNYLSSDLTIPKEQFPEGYTIDSYRSEHNNIEEKLFDLKNIIIKYLPSPENQVLCFNVLSALFILEQDMNDHSRIEDNVLIPKVILMEKSVRHQIKKT